MPRESGPAFDLQRGEIQICPIRCGLPRLGHFTQPCVVPLSANSVSPTAGSSTMVRARGPQSVIVPYEVDGLGDASEGPGLSLRGTPSPLSYRLRRMFRPSRKSESCRSVIRWLFMSSPSSQRFSFFSGPRQRIRTGTRTIFGQALSPSSILPV